MKKNKLLTSILALSLVFTLGACHLEDDEILDDSSESTSGDTGSVDPSSCSHTNKSYILDEDNPYYHVSKCLDCGAIFEQDRAIHQVYDDDGDCIYCNATGLNTAGLTYDFDYAAETYTITGYSRMANINSKALYVPMYHYGYPVTAIGYENNTYNDAVFMGSEYYNNYLEFVSLPETIEAINPYSFYRCYSLRTINVPAACKTIGSYGFDTCVSLIDITLHEGLERIGSYAFYACYSLESIDIPSSVTMIGDHCFLECYSLNECILHEGLETIGLSAFYSCYSLREIVIPSTLGQINDTTFCYCISLTSITFNEGIASIGMGAFYQDASLNDITIPSSVETIGEGAFEYSGVKNLTILDGVKKIDYGAFSYCNYLTSITLPDDIEIGENAFWSCQTLKFISYPKEATSIPIGAFGWSYSLNSIVIPSSITIIGYQSFYNCYALKDVYFEGTSDEYNITVGNYNEFFNGATKYYYSEQEPSDSGNYWHYDTNGNVAKW